MAEVFLPKVSIIIPVYNGANYLREAVDSALAQTYPNMEVLVVNDGSNDDGATRAVALNYGDKIRYFEKENGGVSSALNYGIRHMTGEYFSWLSHDDKYEPGKVQHSVEYLASFGEREKLIAICGGFYIDQKSARLRDMEMGFEKDRVYSGREVTQYILKHGVMDMCCMLIPRAALEQCPFNEDLRYNQDALLLYQVFSMGYCLAALPEQKDVAYRLHAAQASKTRRDLLLRDSFELVRIIGPVLAVQSTKQCNLLRMLAWRNARLDCKEAVEECIRIGRETQVLAWKDIVYIRLWQLIGKLRNLAKMLYHRLVFKK